MVLKPRFDSPVNSCRTGALVASSEQREEKTKGASVVQCRLVSLYFERGLVWWVCWGGRGGLGEGGGAGGMETPTRSTNGGLGLTATSNPPHRKGRDESGRYVCDPTLHHSPLTPLLPLQSSIRCARAFCGGGQLQFVMSARASLIVD